MWFESQADIIASGLLWLAELIEEHSRYAKSIGIRAIYVGYLHYSTAVHVACADVVAEHHHPSRSTLLYRLPTPPTYPILHILSPSLPPKLLILVALHLPHIAQIYRFLSIGGRGPFHLVLSFRQTCTRAKEIQRTEIPLWT